MPIGTASTADNDKVLVSVQRDLGLSETTKETSNRDLGQVGPDREWFGDVKFNLAAFVHRDGKVNFNHEV